MADVDAVAVDIENGGAYQEVAVEEHITIQLAPAAPCTSGRHSPVSELSDPVEHDGNGNGVVAQIGATRRGSFKNLDDHGPVDPLGDGGEDGEKAAKEHETKIGTIRGRPQQCACLRMRLVFMCCVPQGS